MTSLHIAYIGGEPVDATTIQGLIGDDARIRVSWQTDPDDAHGADLVVADADVELDRLPSGAPVLVLDATMERAARQATAAGVLRGLLDRPASAAELRAALVESAARFDELFTRLADGVVVVDAAGTILLANPAAGTILGRSPAELAGRPFGHPLIGGGWVEIELLHPRGGVVVAEMRAVTARWGDGEVVLVSLRDITGRKRAEEALRLSEERYALAVEGVNDGLFDWRFDRDDAFYSGRWAEMLHLDRSQLGQGGAAWLERVHRDDVEELRTQLDDLRAGRRRQLDCEYRIRTASGRYRWMRARGVVALDGGGRPYRLTGSQTDINERVEAEQGLRYQALHDELTGLPNRAFFNERVDVALREEAAGGGDSFAVLYVDFDRFKWVNDSLGHSAGDKLLRVAATRIVDHVRPGDVVARLGGDEFAIFLPGVTEPATAAAVAQRLHEALEPAYLLDGGEFRCAASIGITLSGWGPGARTRDDVLREADLAMYRAKALGGSRFVFFDRELSEQAVHRVTLEQAMRRGLEEGEFTLHFQPVVSLADGSVHSAEGLVRWHHPYEGLLSPAEFLPIADETGLLIPLGRRVLAVVCEQLARWRDRDVRLAMNVSARQLCQPGLATMIEEQLRQHEVQPDRLIIEITEDALIAQPEQATAALVQLRAIGVRIYADDFGTGFANLAYLMQFPVDGLKLDMSFVRGLPDDRAARAIVEATIMLGRSLGLDVVAEGVERPEQAAFLAAAGCPMAQGYLFGRPEAAAQVDLGTRRLPAPLRAVGRTVRAIDVA